MKNTGFILNTDASSATVTARGGLVYTVPPVPSRTGAGSVMDANGNTISISAAGVITDTLGMALRPVDNKSAPAFVPESDI